MLGPSEDASRLSGGVITESRDSLTLRGCDILKFDFYDGKLDGAKFDGKKERFITLSE